MLPFTSYFEYPLLAPHSQLPLVSMATLMSSEAAHLLFVALLRCVPWNDGSYLAGGRRFQLPRLQAWFSDEGIEYRYADNLLNSHPWTPLLKGVRQQVEAITGHRFNAVLINQYRDGHDCVGWHADDEPDLGPAPTIASLSLGATRTFCLRPKGSSNPADVLSISLPSGTLLLMQAPLQQRWEHAVPPSPQVLSPRVNLTFRLVSTPC